jgi:hypothetical protein
MPALSPAPADIRRRRNSGYARGAAQECAALAKRRISSSLESRPPVKAIKLTKA